MKNKIIAIILVMLFLISIEAVSAVEINIIKKDNESNMLDISSDPELFEISVKIFNEKGIESHKMLLTKTEKEKLDGLFDTFKSNINNANTLKDSVEIYHNMVVSLDEFGFLPEGIDVKSAQRLVTSRFNLLNKFDIFSNKIITQDQNQPLGDVYENSRCLVSGDSTWTGPNLWFLNFIRGLIYEMTGLLIGEVYYGWFSPLAGFYDFASGYIETFSFKKKWNFEGEFVGAIDKDGTVDTMHYIGVTGFIGMMYSDYYFGSAGLVKIRTDIW